MKFVPTVLKEYEAAQEAIEKAETFIADGKAEAAEASRLEKLLRAESAGISVLKMHPEQREKLDAVLQDMSGCKLIRKPGQILTPGAEEASGIYDWLKRTAVYDEISGLWLASMNAEGTVINDNKSASSQLLDVIVLSAIGRKDEAERFYMKLIETELYDRRRKQWNLALDKNNKVIDTDRASYSQLLGVMALYSIGKVKEAQTAYNRLTGRTMLLDMNQGLWNLSIGKNQEILSKNKYTLSQLLGVTVVAMLGEEEQALKLYDVLLKTELYDNEDKQWNEMLDERGKLKTSARASANQLAGVIALASMGRHSEASETYRALKQGQLYEAGYWNWCMSTEQGKVNKEIVSANQLLGVIALAYTGG